MSEGFTLATPQGKLAVIFDDETLKLLCGRSYSRKNGALVRHFLTSWLALLYDSPLDAASLKPVRLIRRFIKRIVGDGLLTTIKRFSDLADQLMNSQGLYGSIDFTNQWVEGFKDTPIFKEYLAFYRTGDPVLFRYILSFSLFGKKLKYENPEWEEVALRNWLGVEERLSTLDFDDNVLCALRHIVAYLIGATDFTNLYPKFGPGKVAERGILDEIDKANNLKSHPYLVSLCNRLLDEHLQRFPYEAFLKGDTGYERVVSRLKFVPKDITKSRSICMERNSVMFFQQALFEAYAIAFASGPMARFVDLRSQQHNRDAALYGSYSGDVDTLDLSAASDSVSFELVKKIFPSKHLFYLALSRSAFVQLPDGSVRRVRKFAPMGSALCFPIQCIIFTAFGIYAAMSHSGWLDMHQTKLRGVVTNQTLERVGSFVESHFARGYGYIHHNAKIYQPLTVFGDDICIDSSLSTTLIKMLTSCGFEVNEGKSFMASSAVRESCGGYYFRGFDVTPLRYTLRGEESRSDAQFVASSIALSNRAGDWGYFNVKRYLMQHILFERGVKRPFLFSSDRNRSYSFYSRDPVNDHLRVLDWTEAMLSLVPKRMTSLKEMPNPKELDIKRQSKGCSAYDSHRREVRCYTFMYKDKRKPEPNESEAHDGYLYMRWWAKQRWNVVQPVMTGSFHRVTAGCRLRQAWTPV